MKQITVPFFISHQGCPHHCIFCDQRIISGSAGTLPNSREITGKINSWLNGANGKSVQVAFFGGTFTALPESVQNSLLEPVQPFLHSGAVSSIRISTRPDCLDSGVVKRLARLGVATIEVGVQSMDDSVLSAAGRGHDAAASWNALQCIKAGGLSAVAQLMPGLPGDTPELSLASLKRVIAAAADCVRIYPVVVLAGTGLAELYLSGAYQPPTIQQGVATCKRLLRFAMSAGIEVIRIGLQADEGLSADKLLAGCWHPAFGQLVRSEMYFDLTCLLTGPGRLNVNQFEIRCHPSRISDVTGHRRVNLSRLEGMARRVERIIPDNLLAAQEISVVAQDGKSLSGNIITDLVELYA